jgi:hypothetical protein
VPPAAAVVVVPPLATVVVVVLGVGLSAVQLKPAGSEELP